MYQYLKAQKEIEMVSVIWALSVTNHVTEKWCFIFYIQLSRSYAPEEDEVHREIIEGIKSVLQNKGTSEFTTLSDTIVLIDKSTLPSMQVTGMVINCKLHTNTKRSAGIRWIAVVVNKNGTNRV